MQFPFEFKPRLCEVGILTAAFQEPSGRQPFDDDPLQAARDVLTNFWIPLAGRQKLVLELGGAFFVQDGYIPPEKMLDPVAPHVPVRTPKAGPGTDLSDADRELILDACAKAGTRVGTIGVFENLMHHDPAIRAQIHQHVKRQGRAAKALGAEGITLFVGRNTTKSPDANWREFIDEVIPLLKYLVDLGLTVYLENCPMPGWNSLGLWVNNMCNTPFSWVAIDECCRRAGISGKVVINYDLSHTILQKSVVGRTFAYVAAAGIPHMIGRIHQKNQHHDEELVAAAEGRGQTSLRGDYVAGELGPDEVQWMSWCEMDSHHGFPGVQHYNPAAALEGREADWLEQQYLLRKLGINPERFVVTLEHEWNANRVRANVPFAAERIEQMIGLSAAFTRGIDAAADAMYQSLAFADACKIDLPNAPDDRFTRHNAKYAAHADNIRERIGLFYAAV